MGFDVAGDFIFVAYTGASKADRVKHGRVESFRARDGTNLGHLEPSEEMGEIGLQDIRECLVAHRRADGEFIVRTIRSFRRVVQCLHRHPADGVPTWHELIDAAQPLLPT